MGRFLSLTITLLLAATLLAAAPNWTKVAERANASTYRLSYPVPDKDDTQAVCSGFSINQRLGYVLTGYHCLGDGLTADGQPTFNLWGDEGSDLAVIVLTVPAKPALHPAPRNADFGQPVLAWGYGFGTFAPILRVGVVSNPEMFVPGLPMKWMMFDGGLIEGMSGGPMLDAHSRVVSIVQRTQEETGTGLGHTIDTIWNYTGRYWEYTR